MKRWLVLGLTVGACTGGRPGPTRVPADTGFAELVALLSEPGGYFDTDNLISNERSYLRAVPALESDDLRGRAYLGVGPSQNFSYIAAMRPAVAFIVDIRRDNLLEHLLFKALFELSPTRAGYLARLLGRPPPDTAGAGGADIDRIVESIDALAPDPDAASASLAAVATKVRGYGIPLSEDDLATIAAFHQAFIDAGLDLRFRSFNRAPQWYYPTYRELLLETDATGRRRNLFATAGAYGFVRDLEMADLIIPVVGNLAGPHAVRAIGDYLRSRNLTVGVFYTSNVEFYLFGDGTFDRFVANLDGLPLADGALIVRSIFGRLGSGPGRLPGYGSTQLTASARGLVDSYQQGGIVRYRDLWRESIRP